MKRYCVYCTQIWNATKEVEANSKEDAVSKVQEMISENLNSVKWEFGEATSDFAEEI